MGNLKPPSRFSRVRDVYFSIAFFTVLIIPAFIKIPPPADFNKTPGKFLSDHPKLNKYWNLIQLTGAYQTYFSEHFMFRDQSVILHNEILRSVLGSITFHDVLVGRKGWLFLTDEDNLSYYQCDKPFTPDELTTLVDRIKGMREFSRENGAEFLLLIAPNKESIYPEFLPAGINPSGKTCRMDQALEALQAAGVYTLDLRKTLKEEKSNNQLFFKTDTHWNDNGAFLVYQTIFSELMKVFPDLDIWGFTDFKPVSYLRTGDLSKLIPLFSPISEVAISLEPIRERNATVLQGDNSQTILSETGIGSNPDAVIFRDSFFMGLLPFFAENFNKAVYRWSFEFDENLILSEKPDIVIYELAERYLEILVH